MYEINLKRGVSGWQLVIVVSMILGVIILAFAWIFMETAADLSGDVFVKLSKEIKDKICDAFGAWGQTIGRLAGCYT